MKRISLAIGNFDGVHIGHQALLARAQKGGAALQVLTFDPHPLAFLRPEQAPLRLYDNGQRLHWLHEVGVESVKVVDFNREISQMSGEEFFKMKILPMGPAQVTVGDEFRFGKSRQAGVLELKRMCEHENIQFSAVEPECLDGQVVSSSRVRTHLAQAHFAEAARLLGREYSFCGQVIKGRELGRTIGFPTANLQLPGERRGQLPLRRGVYAGLHSMHGPFIMNLGLAPTVTEEQVLRTEVHFLKLNLDLYGAHLEITPQYYLREETKFANLEALKNQLHEDRRLAEKLLVPKSGEKS